MDTQKMIEELVSFLNECRTAYYEGSPIVSDEEFDEMEARLKGLDSENDYFSQVGHRSIKNDEIKIQHFFPMLSMNKADVNYPIDKWYRSNSIPDDEEILGELKVDGISGSLIYNNGKLDYGVTRGDGKMGKLIKFIGKMKLDGIPDRIPVSSGRVDIRGEFYIKCKHSALAFKDKPLRNCASGIVNKSGEDIEYLSFVAYQRFLVDGNDEVQKESEILKNLKSYGFNVVHHKVLRSIKDIKAFLEDYINNRDSFEYETDGIVITVNSRKLQMSINMKRIVRSFNFYNIAIKPPSKTGKSKLIGFELNVSKSGRLVPVLIFESVVVANVEITRATMDNYGTLSGVGPLYYGNTVYIKRANDVIPKVVGIDADGNKNMPIVIDTDTCPACGGQLKIVTNPDSGVKNLYCENEQCHGRKISIIYNWVERLGMKNVGYKFVEKAYNENIINKIEDLYDPDLKNKLAKLRGFVDGGGRIGKIIEAIDSSTMGISDIDIINGVGIPGVGKISLVNHGITNIDTIWKDVTDMSRAHFAVCDYIRKWLMNDENFSTIKRLKDILKTEASSIQIQTGSSVCITGTFDIPREEIEKRLTEKSFQIVKTVSSKTNYLLVGENAGSKLDKAESYGTVKIIRDLSELI